MKDQSGCRKRVGRRRPPEPTNRPWLAVEAYDECLNKVPPHLLKQAGGVAPKAAPSARPARYQRDSPARACLSRLSDLFSAPPTEGAT